MPVYVVTGANRGLGLEFVRQLITNPSNTIIATSRSPSEKLTDFQASAKKLHLLTCDTGILSSISKFAEQVSNTIGAKTKIDYLINNAGINSVPEQTSLALRAEDLHDHITVNVLGPAKTVEALLPHLQQGSVVVNMSSGVGSLSYNKTRAPECTNYCISKAALNMLTVHQAGELRDRGVKVISMDPGWVLTDMGGPKARLQPEQSIKGMLDVMHGLKEGDSAKYLEYSGKEVAW